MAAEYQIMDEDEPREEYVFVEEYFPLDLHEEEVIAEPLDAQDIIVQTADHQEIVRAVTIHREDGPSIKSEIIASANIISDGYDPTDPNSWTTQEEVIIESSENAPQAAIIKLESEEESQTHVYECYKCAKRFHYKDKLFKHMKLHHARGDDIMIERDGKRIWTCTQCDKTFISRKGSIIHQRTHTGERPYSCSVCHKRFIDSSTLMKHQVIHQAVRPFSCLICRRGFNQKVALQRHERTHGQIQPNFKCKFCPKTFLVGSSLQAHEKIHSGIKPYTCQYCPSRFHTSTAQRQHERVHTNERPYACSYCPKAFKDSGTLFKHQVIHSGIRPFVCPICSQGFTQKVALRKHIRSHVSRNQDNICEVCDTQFFSKDDLCAHVEDHIEQHPSISQKHKQELLVAEAAEKPTSPEPRRTTSDLSDLATLCDVAISTAGDLAQSFPCLHCGMTFRRKKSLDSHLSIHRMNCKYCDRSFPDRIALDKHEKKCCSKVLIHTKPKQPSEALSLVGATVIATGDGSTTIIENIGDSGVSKDLLGGKNPKRYFYCERCDKTFSSRNGYIIHQRSHTGERPYPCRWCDKAFGDSATRHKHERIHTGERPFKCHRCPRAFNQRAALRAHQVTHTVDRAFLCKYCPSSFPYFATLKRHQQSCHASIPCPLCSATATDGKKLHLHIKNMHCSEGNLSCSLCDSGIFTDPSEYCDHMVWHGKQQQGEPKSMEDSEAEKETQIEIIEPEELIKQEVIEEEEIITEEVYTTEETYEVHEEPSFIEEGYSEEVYTQGDERNEEEVIEQTVVTDDYQIVDGGYGCDVCGLMFTEKEALQEHVPLHF